MTWRLINYSGNLMLTSVPKLRFFFSQSGSPPEAIRKPNKPYTERLPRFPVCFILRLYTCLSLIRFGAPPRLSRSN
jgi:hypothetical protein